MLPVWAERFASTLNCTSHCLFTHAAVIVSHQALCIAPSACYSCRRATSTHAWCTVDDGLDMESRSDTVAVGTVPIKGIPAAPDPRYSSQPEAPETHTVLCEL